MISLLHENITAYPLKVLHSKRSLLINIRLGRKWLTLADVQAYCGTALLELQKSTGLIFTKLYEVLVKIVRYFFLRILIFSEKTIKWLLILLKNVLSIPNIYKDTFLKTSFFKKFVNTHPCPTFTQFRMAE